MHILPRINLFLILFLLFCGHITAQVTSGSLAGFVTDEKKQDLPGATVRAIHQPSGSIYATSAQHDGGFQISNMRIGGPYKVEIFYLGYETATYDNIYLALGDPYLLPVKMTQGNQELQTVTITGAAKDQLLNRQRTGASTHISAEQLNTLPTVSRSLTDFTRLTPQSGPSFSSGVNNNNSFAGRDGRYNNVQINGANFNNSFGLNSNLLPGGSAQPVSLDAIEEVQVGIAPYDIRQNGFTGANINAITRSGTNEFSGSAYMYWRNQTFNGAHVGNKDIPEQAASTNNIYGARIGGPVIKNKLFFFVNGEYEKNQYPGITWLASRPGITGPNISRTAADSLEAVAAYLKDKFGYDPGAYEDYGNRFVNKNTKFLARVDWNISTRHKFYVNYSRMNATEDQRVNDRSAAGGSVTNTRVGAASLAFSNSNFTFEHNVSSLTAELGSNFSGGLSNQLIVCYSGSRDQRTTPGTLFPFIDIAVSKSNISDNYISLGTDLFSYKNDVQNTNLSFTDNLTYSMDAHTFAAGLSYEYQTFGNSFLPYGTSYYRFASVSDLIGNKAPVAFGYTYSYEGQDSYVKTNFGLGSAYLQDKYSVGSRLSITAGLRIELPFYTYDLPVNKYIDTLLLLDAGGQMVHYDASKWPAQKMLVSPRLSFNWDVSGDRRLQVRGGTGIFAGRVPFVWLTNQPGNTGTLTNQVQITNAAALNNFTLNPDALHPLSSLPQDTINKYFPQQGGSAVPGQIALVAPDFKMPRLWRTSISADFRLPGFLIGTLEAIYSRDIVNVYQRNANLPEAQATLKNGADQRPFYTGNRTYGNVSGIYVLENTNKGQSFSFTAGLTRQLRKGCYGSLYYTASFAEDVSSNPGSQPSSTWNSLPNNSSPNDVVLSPSEYMTPHRIVGTLSYRFEYFRHLATTLSVYYEGASLGRYSYLYNTDINKDGSPIDLIYIPKDANELQWADIKDKDGSVLFTQQQQADAFNDYISQDKYLSKHRGAYAERYGAKYPFYSRFDLKLLQEVFISTGKRRHTVQFSMDMLNAGNFINPGWGVQQRLTVGSGNNSTILTVTNAGTLTPGTQPVYQLSAVKDNNGNTRLPGSTYTDNVSTLSTWSMQLGVRYIF